MTTIVRVGKAIAVRKRMKESLVTDNERKCVYVLCPFLSCMPYPTRDGGCRVSRGLSSVTKTSGLKPASQHHKRGIRDHRIPETMRKRPNCVLQIMCRAGSLLCSMTGCIVSHWSLSIFLLVLSSQCLEPPGPSQESA